MITYDPWPTLFAVGVMTRALVADRPRPVPTFCSVARVSGLVVAGTASFPAAARVWPAIVVNADDIVAAEAAPADRAETATAVIKIFFIDILVIPLEVL